MWACAERAPAELCAEGASPARGSGKSNAVRVESGACCDKGAPYKSGRGSRAGSIKMYPFKDLGFSEVFSILQGGSKSV